MRIRLWLLGCFIWFAVIPIYGHGVNLQYSVDAASGAITIQAAFDNGEALDAAQVAVFAPSDLLNPWLTGVTDAAGAFTFQPDYTIEGTWDVQVRKAGHGGLIHITLETGMSPQNTSAAQDAAYTPAQIALMSGSVIWGFIGTALYFQQRRERKKAA